MKCKDIAHKYHVTPMQVGRLRKKLNPDNKGGELSEEEVEALSYYYDELESLPEREELEKSVESETVDGYCTYVQAGRREVECKIRSGGEIESVVALIPSSVSPEWCLNKPMKLEVIEYRGKKFYRHVALANHAWPKGYGSDE